MKTIKKITVSLLAIFLFANIMFAQKKEAAKDSLENVKYVEMTNGEKRRFIENEVNEMLGLFRRVQGDELNSRSVGEIKRYIDGYIKRTSSRRKSRATCGFGDSLPDVLQRGTRVAPMINKSFAKNDLPVQTGLYIAMIESEFCACLQSPAGALGMFQFVRAVAKDNGLVVKANGSSQNPDERCEPAKASLAASNFLNKLLNSEFGRNSIGFPLAIASYNAGQGATRRNMKNVQKETKVEDVSFWLMLDLYRESFEKDDTEKRKLFSRQFQAENSRYVPKFFAAAIIGENPRNFGFEMLPLSQVK